MVFHSAPPFHGTLTRYLAHPASWLHKLPKGVSYEEGALCEPLAVALAGIELADLRLGDPLLIWYVLYYDPASPRSGRTRVIMIAMWMRSPLTSWTCVEVGTRAKEKKDFRKVKTGPPYSLTLTHIAAQDL